MPNLSAALPDHQRRSDIDWSSLGIVALVATLVMALGLGSTRLWDEDEGYFASAAAEMFARGDVIVPTFNHELFGHKPPMMYWGMMAGYQIFGVNEIGARAGSALFGIATALLTCMLGTRMFNSRVGYFAGIVMGSSLMFSVVARAATPDAHLTFFAVAAVYCFVRNDGLLPRVWSEKQRTAVHGNWLGWACAYAAMALGALTKGPIGLLFPMAVIGLYLLMTTPLKPGTATYLSAAWQKFGPINFLRTVWQMRPITALVVTLVVAGPWYFLVDLQTGGKFLAEFFGVHHLQRFSSAMDNHSGPIFYYVVACLIGLFPWSIFAMPAAIEWIKSLRSKVNDPHYTSLLFVSSWVGVYLVIFSLARTKLPNYVLPAYPALALMVGFYVDAWLHAPQQVHRGWLRAAQVTFIVVGILATVGLALAGKPIGGERSLLDLARIPTELQQQSIWLALIGLPVIVGGILVLILSERMQTGRACQAFTATSVVTLMLLWNFAAPIVDQFQAPQTIATQLRGYATEPIRVATLHCFKPSMCFYAQQKIDCFDNEEATESALAAVNSDERTYLITTIGQYEKLAQSWPQDLVVVERRPGFPLKEDLVVLARQSTVERLPVALQPKELRR